MKKILIVVFLLLILFSFLFAEGVEKESKITLWGIVGIILSFLIFFAFLIFISAVISQGTFDSGNILIRKGEKISLHLNPFPAEETEKVTIGVLIKEIVGNQITLQCEICQQGKTLLTKLIGVEKGKKVTDQIKKILNYPIEISVDPSNKDQIRINVEKTLSLENMPIDTYSSNAWD